MARPKTVFTAEMAFVSIPLEGVKVKYKLLPSVDTPAKGKKKAPAKVHVEIESVTAGGRDVGWAFDTKALEEWCVLDSQKQLQGGHISDET